MLRYCTHLEALLCVCAGYSYVEVFLAVWVFAFVGLMVCVAVTFDALLYAGALAEWACGVVGWFILVDLVNCHGAVRA
jgi:hypothetical protein